ncbi:non-homologous end-joining DNA ligase LigD [Luteococcus sp. Sow4_B9]|uniref:non-homologous end-joining DNA ligase LigD n=1 Tax=Luteococcus sp. Sow4_B9 TaxID=3438792 RepID=UPI003F98FE10
MARTAVTLDVDGQPVRLSSPDKVYFPELGITKLDVANHVLTVGDGMLCALRHRPTTMERWPAGVQDGLTIGALGPDKGNPFYQKRAPQGHA